MTQKIIGICGLAGSGKSTLARGLVSNFGYTRVPFAGPLKRMIAVLLSYQGLTPDAIDYALNGEGKTIATPFLGGRTPRYAMQTLGTEWRNMINKNLWTDAWYNTVDKMKPDAKIVVDDLRFQHEADAIRNKKGVIIVIARPGIEFGADRHPSETEFIEFKADISITNNGTPFDMLYNLSSLIGRGL